MKTAITALLLLLSMLALPALAADRPASEASIKHLLEVTKTKKLVDGMMSKMDEMRTSSMKLAMSGQALTPQQDEAVLEMQQKMAGVLKDELDWETLEPMYIEIYKETFTQKEVDGMLLFYKTPSGQAVIKKMPVVMEAAMQMMQKRVATIVPKLQQIITEEMEKMMKASSEQ